MASLKIDLHSKKYSDGTRPVVLRVIVDSIVRRKVICRIPLREWDKKARAVKWTHPLAVEYNALLLNSLQEAQRRLLRLQKTGRPFTADDVLKVQGTSLIEVINAYFARPGTSLAHQDARKALLRKVTAYAPKGVAVEDLSPQWVNGFKAFLDDQGLKSDTMRLYFVWLRSAIKAAGLEAPALDKVVIRKTPSTPATLPTWQDFIKFRDAPVANSRRALYRDIFVVQVYLRGTRVGEVLQLQHSAVEDGRLITQSTKTAKIRSIELPGEVLAILKRYEGQSRYYLLPALTQPPGDFRTNARYRRHVKSKTGQVSHHSSKVFESIGFTGRVTSHTARHIFALRSVEKGANLKEIQAFLDHSSVATTAGYLKGLLNAKDLDDKARDILAD